MKRKKIIITAPLLIFALQISIIQSVLAAQNISDAQSVSDAKNILMTQNV
ncbi:MAG: hypothetical protein LBF01_02030 [Bacteroidales bacterium]|jgi:hypothetical protein|nr:hypothetical protein [Bacteroidales bacterium]